MQSINATRKISGAHNWAGLYANVFGGSAQHFLDSNRSVDAWKQQKKKADLDIPVWFVFLRSLCDGHRIELHHLVFNGIFSFKGVWNWPYPPPTLIASSTRMVSISSAVKSRCYFTITWCGSISLTLKKFRFQFQFPFCFVFFLFHRISPLNIGNPFNLKTKCTGEEGALKNRPHFDA